MAATWSRDSTDDDGDDDDVVAVLVVVVLKANATLDQNAIIPPVVPAKRWRRENSVFIDDKASTDGSSKRSRITINIDTRTNRAKIVE
jgi:hypothetical protein